MFRVAFIDQCATDSDEAAAQEKNSVAETEDLRTAFGGNT
jgi:hypothetical protein